MKSVRRYHFYPCIFMSICGKACCMFASSSFEICYSTMCIDFWLCLHRRRNTRHSVSRVVLLLSDITQSNVIWQFLLHCWRHTGNKFTHSNCIKVTKEMNQSNSFMPHWYEGSWMVSIHHICNKFKHYYIATYHIYIQVYLLK